MMRFIQIKARVYCGVLSLCLFVACNPSVTLKDGEACDEASQCEEGRSCSVASTGGFAVCTPPGGSTLPPADMNVSVVDMPADMEVEEDMSPMSDADMVDASEGDMERCTPGTMGCACEALERCQGAGLTCDQGSMTCVMATSTVGACAPQALMCDGNGARCVCLSRSGSHTPGPSHEISATQGGVKHVVRGAILAPYSGVPMRSTDGAMVVRPHP